jgi:short-subunit dehydrogenase
VVEELKEKGITAVDVVIANAAINLSHPIKFIDIDTDDQDETFRINVRSFTTDILSFRLHTG